MRKNYILLFLAALLAPLGAKAQETLTVADGTETNAYVPIYGFYADAYIRAQMIFPADMINDMSGGNITSLTWYMQSTSASAWGINVVVSIAEVDEASFTSNSFSTAELTEVWSGTVNGLTSTWEIELEEPFTYSGGNLLIDVHSTNEGNYSACSWTGISQTGGSVSTYSYNTPVGTGNSASIRNFLPKTTFGYAAGGAFCRKPGSLTLDEATTESLSFHWTPRNGESSWLVSIDGGDYDVATDTFYTAYGLTHSSAHSVAVRAFCDPDTSTATTASWMTACAPIEEFPFLETFEGLELTCWVNPANDWQVLNSPSSAYEGTYMLYNYMNGLVAANSYIISPEIIVPSDAEDLELSWFAQIRGNYSSQSHGSFEVLISGDASTTIDDSYTTVLVVDSIFNFNFLRYSVLLDEYAGQTIRVAFHHTTPAYGNSNYWREFYIDNLAIHNANMPVARIGRYSYREGHSEANVMIGESATFEAWLTSGSEDNLTYTWSSAKADAGNATLNPMGNMLEIIYDEPGMDTITLEAANDAGSSTVSLLVQIDTFDLATLPFMASFNSAEEYAPWVLFSLDSTTLSGYGLFNPAYAGSSAAGSFALADYGQTDVMLVSPAIAVPEDVANMSLIYHVAGFIYTGDTAHPATYDVLVSNSGRSSYIYFTDTILHDTVFQNAYEYRNLNLNGYAGDTVYLAFRHTSVGAQGLVIDEIEVREAAFPVISVDYPTVADIDDTVTYTTVMVEGVTEGATYTWTSTMEAAGSASFIDMGYDSIYTLHYTGVGIDTVKVVVTNSFGSDSATMYVRVRDLAPVTELPYTTSFEDAVDNAAWDIITAGDNAWTTGTAVSNDSTHALYVSNDNGASNNYNSGSGSISFASRYIVMTPGEYSLSYDWMAYGESCCDFIRVMLAPNDIDFSSFTYSDFTSSTNIDNCLNLSDKLNAQSTWQTEQTTFSVAAAGTYQLVFCWRNDGSIGTSPAGAIDNVTLTALTCPRPSTLVVDYTGTDTIAFHWTPTGEETSWELVFGDNDPVVVTDTFYVAENLEANTAYSISVRAICGEGDTSFATTAEARTECGDITIPYFEGFENGGEACWRILNYYNNSTNTGVTTSYSYSGTHCHAFYPGYDYQPVFAVLPRMNEVNTLMVNFMVKGSSYSTVTVGTMASASDTTTFVPLYSINALTNQWIEQEVHFDADTTGNEYIAFRFGVNSSWGYYAYLDDVSVMVAPSCQRPESVSATDIEATSATITITDTTEVNNYQIIVVNTATGDTAYSDLVNSTSQEVTGLTAFTEYTVTAYAVCDDGTITLSVNTTFRTACENGNCEFTVAMADTYGDGWNGNAINVWQNGEVFTSLTIANGSAANANVSVCLGSPVELIWQSGSYAYETSFTITSADDSVILALDGDSLVNGDTLVVFDGLCGVQFVYSGNIVDTTEPEPGPQPLPCDAPTITGATATDNNVTVIWNGTASNYEVAIVEGAWQEPADVVTTTGPGYTFTGLQASTQYTVGVRAVCADTVSNWATRNVTTAAPADTTDTIGIRLAETALFSLYPNPATTTVTVDLGSHSQATVAVIDQSGRLNGEWRVENGKLELNVGRLAKGAYYVRVTTAESTSVRKLIVR